MRDDATPRGDAMAIEQWSIAARYHQRDPGYWFSSVCAYVGMTDTGHGPLPTQFDLYISDTPPGGNVGIGIAGYAFSPRYRTFKQLNEATWYRGEIGPAPGMAYSSGGDEIYLRSWKFSEITARTPTRLTVAP